MILIFGGTTEGKQVIQLMNQLKQRYHYSTKTKVEYADDSFGVYRFGVLDEAALFYYVQQHKITQIINAAHPFASLLHQTIEIVSQRLNLPVYRLERVYEQEQKNTLIHYVDNYEKGLGLLFQQFEGKQLLALSGVQSIPKLRPYWSLYTTIFRILDRASSLEFAIKQEFPKAQLILAYPNKEITEEIAVYQNYQAEIILTKESGGSGYLATKIKAALSLEIPIIIIKKPKTPTSFLPINNLKELAIKLL